MNGDIFRRKFDCLVHAVFKVVKRLSGQHGNQIHIDVKLFPDESVSVYDVFDLMCPAYLIERLLIEALRINRYSRDLCPSQNLEGFFRDGIGSARLYGEFLLPEFKTSQHRLKFPYFKRRGRPSANIYCSDRILFVFDYFFYL